MNIALLLAGVMSFVAAAIHGIAGDVLIVRRIDVGSLPSTRFGGPAASKVMIRVTWHLLTATFVVLGSTMVACGFNDVHDACRATGIVGASAFSAFAVITITSGVARSGPAGPASRAGGLHCDRGTRVVGSLLTPMPFASWTAA